MTDHAALKSVYPASADFVAKAHVDAEAYAARYAASVADPEAFWGREGLRLDWIKPYTKVKNSSFAPGNISIRWFEDGVLNVSANCIDRHMLMLPGAKELFLTFV